MDRVAMLSAGKKRRASCSPMSGTFNERTNSQAALLKASHNKLQRRDSLLPEDENNSCSWKLGTQPSQEDLDSAHTTVFRPAGGAGVHTHSDTCAHAHQAAPIAAPCRTDDLECDDSCCCADTGEALAAREDMEAVGEVDGPPMAPMVQAEQYIRGTRLIIGGWFQACRGCNEPTAHTAAVRDRDVYLCPRCQGKYRGMVAGEYPSSALEQGGVDPSVEPLCYWLPRMLVPMRPMSADARRDFCDLLLLRQDDAWAALVKVS